MSGPRWKADPPISTRMTLWEAFAAAMAAVPDREAVVADDGRLTAAALLAATVAFSVRLSQAGARPGQRILLLLPNSARYAAAFFAVARIGGTAVPLNPGLTRRELAGVATATGAGLAVVASATSAEAVREAFADVGRDCMAVHYDGIDTKADLVDGPGHANGPAPVHQSRPGRPAAAEAACLFFTSGTTGTPKAVAHSHRSLIASFLALQRMHREFFDGPPSQRIRRAVTVTRRYGRRVIRAAGHQTWLTPIPFHAIGGHEVLTGALFGGHKLVTTPEFHPRRTMGLLDREKVNVFAATPAMVDTMLSLRDFATFDLSSLLVVGMGGAPASPDLVRKAQAHFRCSVTVGYGATELGGGVLVTRIDDADEVKRDTVGRPFPGADVRIVDDDGQDVPAGSSGELLCRVTSLMAGYTSSPGEHDTVDETGWYHTNDLAIRDQAGNIRIIGRRDDLIIRGGNKIRPTEVEQVLDSAAGVRQSAVVGVATGRSQQVWAFVVPEQAGSPPDRITLLAHCQASLAAYKVPDHIRVCESLPVTSLGKIQRYLLAQLAQEESSTSVVATSRGEHSGL